MHIIQHEHKLETVEQTTELIHRVNKSRKLDDLGKGINFFKEKGNHEICSLQMLNNYYIQNKVRIHTLKLSNVV